MDYARKKCYKRTMLHGFTTWQFFSGKWRNSLVTCIVYIPFYGISHFLFPKAQIINKLLVVYLIIRIGIML